MHGIGEWNGSTRMMRRSRTQNEHDPSGRGYCYYSEFRGDLGMDSIEKKAKDEGVNTEEEKKQSFNVSRDYVNDPRFADFTPYNQKSIDENVQSHYSLFPD